MHTSTALIAALAAISFPQAQANPIEARQNVGFTLEQQPYGKRLKNGPIALGNLYKKVDADMPSEVLDAFSVATQSQAPDMLNKNKRQATAAAATKPKPTSTSTSSSSIRTTSSSSSSSSSSVRTTSSSTSSSSIRTTTSSSSSSSIRTTSSSSSTSTKASSTYQSGSAVATPVNEFDTAYMIPITVGGTTVYVDVDTGSSDLWVLSNLQPSSQTSGHNIYSPSASNLKSGYSWNVTYLDGSTASGAVYNDTVGMGGMTFKGQSVEAAKTASDAFVDAAYDGMLGLAFDVLNTVQPVQQKTLFNSIKSQLPSPVFTSLLKHNAPGSFDFGYVDSKKYTGAITYSNVDTSNGWWQFNANGYSIGSGAAVSQTFASVVDTGTTLMVLPSTIVTAYYAKVTNASYWSDYGAWVYPCSATLPNFNLIVNGAAQTIPGSLMTYGPIDYNGNCYGGLQQNDNIGVAILGTIFIKSQFVVYDQSTTPPRVGFAKQAGLSYTS
ncbi:aspartyl protease [Diplodia corticola]|uniref:Aspartyl protease n=1 Tax=Diplodia corticola TaxID=236234 RepID=A0A1J9R142_9PEZI|nr:aspartyl protease [Diplodia corticola]OJD33954.1 aspartyl protease [Diplodia corticola]